MSFKQDVKNNILRMSSEGGDGNFLIVSAGDYYIQFAGSPGESFVHCEIVSNQFLPENKRLNSAQIIQIEDLGFENPENSSSGVPNFNRAYQINNENRLNALIDDVYFVFFKIIKLSLETQFNLELTFQ